MAKRHPGNWSWAENYDGENLTEENLCAAYSLNNKIHKPFTCRKNCRSNPSCLSGFGESNWKEPIDADSQKSESQRLPGAFVGLKNLGNTCYVSCLLQLWFHNIPLREAVYLWNALEDDFERERQIEKYGKEPHPDDYKPLTSVAHLQILFAEMEFGTQAYCDPEAFCRSLSIDVELQQDAQEFSKLYMSRLESAFVTATNSKTRTVIQSQFRGEYSYVTTCSKCKTESRRDSFFYELELSVKGFKTIQESMDEFIRDETLAGDNKYLCSVCDSKEDAVTGIRLKVLPPILQLQLIRYWFDMTTATKKKISQAIEFPDILDMSPYLSLPPNSCLYSLQAVLMHGGSSADSGHYYAHIKTVNGWHVFDDTTVKKQKQLSLISDDPLVGKSTSTEKKQPKVKGSRSSSSAYMLVYSKIEANAVSPETRLQLMTESPLSSLDISKPVLLNTCGKGEPMKVESASATLDLLMNAKDSEEETKMDHSDVITSCPKRVKTEEYTKDFRKLSFSDSAEDTWQTCISEDTTIIKNCFGNIKSENMEVVEGSSDFEIVEVNPSNDITTLRSDPRCNDPLMMQEVASLEEDKPPEGGGGGEPQRGRSTEIVNALKEKHWKLLPDYLKTHVNRLNDELSKSQEIELKDIAMRNLHQDFVKNFMDIISPQTPLNLNECEFMHSESLVNLTKSSDVAPLNNEPLLCPHGCLNFEAVKDYKLVSHEAAARFVGAFGGGPRITGKQLCRRCVSRRAQITHLRAILKTDLKTIAHLLRPAIDQGETGFWVGKKALRSWSAPVEKRFEELESKLGTEPLLNAEQVAEVFNSDITCPHGGLNIDEDDRRLVNTPVWDLLTKYYPNHKKFDQYFSPCISCQTDHDVGKINEQQLRERAIHEKEVLSRLLTESSESVATEPICYLISSAFVIAWRRHVRSASHQVFKEKPHSDLIFKPLFCHPHSRLIYDPNFDTDRFFLLNSGEYEILQELYNVNESLFASRSEDGTLETSIKICSECIANRISSDQFKSLEESYVRAKIYVCKVTTEIEDEPSLSPESKNNKIAAARKRKIDELSAVPPAKKPTTELVRRSARARQPKGERESFIVDKTTTLKEFKVMICAKMSVMPCDQHLYLDNGEDLDELLSQQNLSSSDATLLRLGVPPDSTLRLVADEPKADQDFLSEGGRSEPETGFKGTELGGR